MLETQIETKKLQTILDMYREEKSEDWICDERLIDIIHEFVYRQWNEYRIVESYSLIAVYAAIKMFACRRRGGMLRKGFEFEVELRNQLDLL